MNKKIKRITTFFAVLCLPFAVLIANPIDNKTAVGVYFTSALNSNANAYGLEFEQYINPKMALGVIGAAFYDNADDYSINANLQFKYSLIEGDFNEHFSSRLYAYGIIGYNGWSLTYYDYSNIVDYEHQNPVPVKTKYHDVFTSLGFGIDFILVDHLSLPINFGFAGKFPNNPSAGFCLGTGIRYSF